jgi:hypothetical protein
VVHIATDRVVPPAQYADTQRGLPLDRQRIAPPPMSPQQLQLHTPQSPAAADPAALAAPMQGMRVSGGERPRVQFMPVPGLPQQQQQQQPEPHERPGTALSVRSAPSAAPASAALPAAFARAAAPAGAAAAAAGRGGADFYSWLQVLEAVQVRPQPLAMRVSLLC